MPKPLAPRRAPPFAFFFFFMADLLSSPVAIVSIAAPATPALSITVVSTTPASAFAASLAAARRSARVPGGRMVTLVPAPSLSSMISP